MNSFVKTGVMTELLMQIPAVYIGQVPILELLQLRMEHKN